MGYRINCNSLCSLTSNVSGTLPTSKGGTGIDSSSSAFTRYALFYASNTTVMGQLAAATDGQVLIGSSSDAPVWASLTSGDGSIAITSGAGSIGLSVTSIPTINSNVEFTAGSDRYIKPKVLQQLQIDCMFKEELLQMELEEIYI